MSRNLCQKLTNPSPCSSQKEGGGKECERVANYRLRFLGGAGKHPPASLSSPYLEGGAGGERKKVLLQGEKDISLSLSLSSFLRMSFMSFLSLGKGGNIFTGKGIN